MITHRVFSKQLQRILKQGGVAVIPTDTLYGIVGSALKRATVERIYRLRQRAPHKPMIILIGSLGDLKKFGVKFDKYSKGVLEKVWPGPVSVVLPVSGKKFHYLHRGTKTLAFRLPRSRRLRALLKITGPLVAPSANLEGKAQAKNIFQAQKYFMKKVEMYIEGGTLSSQPSLLIQPHNGMIRLLRGEAKRFEKLVG